MFFGFPQTPTDPLSRVICFAMSFRRLSNSLRHSFSLEFRTLRIRSTSSYEGLLFEEQSSVPRKDVLLLLLTVVSRDLPPVIQKGRPLSQVSAESLSRGPSSSTPHL